MHIDNLGIDFEKIVDNNNTKTILQSLKNLTLILLRTRLIKKWQLQAAIFFYHLLTI